MSRRRKARHFAVAFAITVAVVAVAAVLRTTDQGGDGAARDVDLTTTSGATVSSASSAVTLVAETIEAPVDPSRPRSELPMLDFEQICRDLEGDDATFGDSPDRFGLTCVTVDGEQVSLDVRNACERSFGEGIRAVLIEANTGADAWRCTVSEPIVLGQPDWQAECSRRFGETGVAFLLADDSLGWRCASTVNGIYAEDEVFQDAACQTTFGSQSYGEVVGSAPDDNVCYGAST